MSTTERVVKLVIRGEGLEMLGRIEQGMARTGQAADEATGGMARFDAIMQKQRAAQEKGLALMTETIARKSQERLAYERTASSISKDFALRIRLEREAERSAVTLSNAVSRGIVSEKDARALLMVQQEKHLQMLTRATAQEHGMAEALDRTAAAAGRATLSVRQLNAANENRRVGSNPQFSTANIAAQMFDVGVTAPFMPAWQVGLQQGSQLAQAFAGQSLRQSIMGVGSALVSLVNPVSLLTIGFTTLTALGIQAFMNLSNANDDAVGRLEAHREELDRLLDGYAAAREAADAVLSQQTSLPEASLMSDLTVFRDDALRRYEGDLERVRQVQADWKSVTIDLMPQAYGDPVLISQMQRVFDIVDEAGLSSRTTAAEFDMLHTTLTLIKNSGADDNVVAIADALLMVVNQAREGKAMVDSLGASLDALPSSVTTKISIQMEGYNSAIKSLDDLMPDFRSSFDRARADAQAALDKARKDATDRILVVAAERKFSDVMAGIARQEAEANAKSGARAARDAQQPYDQWGTSLENMQQRIASQRLERELLGQSTYEIERQKAAFDLLNQAKQAGIPITSEVTGQISQLSAEYARETTALEKAAEARRKADEQLSFYKSTVSGFVLGLAASLRTGEDFWESFANAGVNALDRIADRALSMAVDGIWDMIFGAFTGGVGGGLGGGWGVAGSFGRPGIFGLPSFAGGGDTGYGARTGGLDGQGGFLALLHPQETVSDHYGRSYAPPAANQNQSNDNAPRNININVTVSGARGNAEVRQMVAEGVETGLKAYDSRLGDSFADKRRRAAPGALGL